MKRRIVIALAILASVVSVGQVTAQQSTPVASGCVGPADVSAPAFPEAPPASPEATASPVASPVVPAGDLITDQVAQIAESLAVCLSAADSDGITALTTAEFLGDMFGGGERLTPAEFQTIVAGAPVIETRIVAVENVSFSGMSTVSADMQLIYGHQLLFERWTFLYRDLGPTDGTSIDTTQGLWRAHRIEPLATNVPSGAETVEATLDEYVIRLDSSTVDGPDIVIEAVNDGSEAHELLVVELAAGATVEQLLRPTPNGFPDGIDVAGQISLLPGEEGVLVLVDLEPGSYTIVCLFPDSSGVPHLSFGQATSLQIR